MGLKREAKLSSEDAVGHAWASDIVRKKMGSCGRNFGTESPPMDFFLCVCDKINLLTTWKDCRIGVLIAKRQTESV